jgi:hypothetical protein
MQLNGDHIDGRRAMHSKGSRSLERDRAVALMRESSLTAVFGRTLALLLAVTSALQFGGGRIVPLALILCLGWSIKVLSADSDVERIRVLFLQLDDQTSGDEGKEWRELIAHQRIARQYGLRNIADRTMRFEPFFWFLLICILAFT